MPQISQLAATYASQIFWLLVFFGFIFFVIGRGMVPKVMATVEARDKQIADDLAAAEAARKAADEQEEAWRVQSNAQRAQAQQATVRMVETYAAAINQPADKVAKALTLAPAASARPSAAPTARPTRPGPPTSTSPSCGPTRPRRTSASASPATCSWMN